MNQLKKQITQVIIAFTCIVGTQPTYAHKPPITYNNPYNFKIQSLFGPYSSEWATPEMATTLPQKEYICNVETLPIPPTNRMPLQFLWPYDKVQVGHFEMEVLKVKGSNGIYSGIGSIYNPQWGITFKVYFENIAINQLYQLTAGVVHAETQGAAAYIAEFEEELDAQDSIPADDEITDNTDTGTDIPQDTITVAGIIDSVFVNPATGDIIVVTEDGETTYEQEVNEEGEKETTLLTDSSGNSWVVDKEGNVSRGIENTQETIDTGNNSDSTQVYITYGKQKYKDKDVIFFPFNSKKKITLKALVTNDTTTNKTFTWKGKGVTSKNEKATIDLSKSTATAKKIELTYGNTTISVLINIVGAYFERLPNGTSGQKNLYGYDEIDQANLDDDHVSVETNGETFIKLNMSTRKLKGIFLKSDNDQIAEAEIAGKNIKIIGKGLNKQQTTIRAYAVNDSTTAIATIAVNVYDKITLSGQIYNVYLAGKSSTKVNNSINASVVKTEANKYLKYPVVELANINTGVQVPIAYDLNGNGKMDFYKTYPQHELNLVYQALQAKGLLFNDIVQFKDAFTRNWEIMDSVKKGDTYVLVKNHPKNPANKGFDINKSYGEYNLQLPNGTKSETFQILKFSGDTVFITTSSNKSVVKGFSSDHPKTSSLSSSHVIVSKAMTGGASPYENDKNPSKSRPALICGSLNTLSIGQRVAHELMHGQNLRDVNDKTNIMHFNTLLNIGDLPFRFKALTPVETGTSTPDSTKSKQNQWENLKGR